MLLIKGNYVFISQKRRCVPASVKARLLKLRAVLLAGSCRDFWKRPSKALFVKPLNPLPAHGRSSQTDGNESNSGPSVVQLLYFWNVSLFWEVAESHLTSRITAQSSLTKGLGTEISRLTFLKSFRLTLKVESHFVVLIYLDLTCCVVEKLFWMHKVVLVHFSWTQCFWQAQDLPQGLLHLKSPCCAFLLTFHDMWRHEGFSSSSSWAASLLTQALRQVLVNDWLWNTPFYQMSTAVQKEFPFKQSISWWGPFPALLKIRTA